MCERRVLSIITMIVVIVPIICFAGWMKTYGWNEYETGRVVQETEDGYVVFGTGKLSAWVLKLDTNGDTIFTKTFGTDFGCWGYDVCSTGDGGYLLAGGIITSEVGLTDAWILRLDSELDSLWSRTYGGAMFDEALGVAHTSDGFVLTGYQDGIEHPQHGYIEDALLWVFKIDTDGNVVWEKSYGDADYFNAAYSISPADGGYILSCSAFYTPATLTRASLLRIDDTGDSLWTYHTNELYFHDAIMASDSSIAACGNQMYYAALAKFSPEGVLDWYQSWGVDAPYTDVAWCIEQTPDGGFVLAGDAKVRYGTTGKPTRGNLWLIKTDENGDTTWTQQYGNEMEFDEGYCVEPTSDGGYIVTGSTQTYGDTEGDLWIVKTDENGNIAVGENPAGEISPYVEMVSAIGQEIVLRFEDRPQGFHARVYDPSGRIVDEIHSNQREGYVRWGDTAQSGVYFIQVQSELPRILRVVLVN